VSDASQARTAVHGRAVVVAVTQLGLAGVEPDPYLDRAGGWPGLDREGALDRNGGGDGVWRRSEDGEAAVAFAARPDMDPVVSCDRVLEQRVMPGECDAHRLGSRFPERGAALHVREEEGHRSARQPLS